MKCWGLLAACAAASLAWGGAPASASGKAHEERRVDTSPLRVGVEDPNHTRSGAARTQRGNASYYAPGLAGRRMADGGRFDPRSDAAPHRTLPLGSKARVSNLENGRSAMVTVRDRGPHAPGRILDVSPGTAKELGMTSEGVAAVEVAPVDARTGGEAEPRSATGGGSSGRARR